MRMLRFVSFVCFLPCPFPFFAAFRRFTLFASAQFKLRLVASDNLNENYTTVVIHIKDKNDNPPGNVIPQFVVFV